MHRAGAQRAARSPGLVDGVLGAFCPYADASAGKDRQGKRTLMPGVPEQFRLAHSLSF